VQNPLLTGTVIGSGGENFSERGARENSVRRREVKGEMQVFIVMEQVVAGRVAIEKFAIEQAIEQVNVGAVFENPVGAGFAQSGFLSRGGEGDNSCAGGFARLDSGGDVFDDDAAGGRKTQDGRGFEVRLGMRLAVRHFAGRDQTRGQRKTGRTQADFGERTSGGRNDGPTVGGKAREQSERAGQRDDALEVFHFAALDFAVLGFVVGVREIVANRGHAGASVSASYDFGGIESVLDGPVMPDAGDGGRGVHENAIHVEKERGAADLGHGTIQESDETNTGWELPICDFRLPIVSVAD